MKIRWKDERDRTWVDALIRDSWAGEPMVVRGLEHALSELPTLIAGDDQGLAIFTLGSDDRLPELLLSQALQTRAGIGTALVDSAVADLRSRGRCRLLVTTTNDNLPALRFYQRYGFRLRDLRPGAVDEARLRKPSIPSIGHDGIAMHDEIDLILDIARRTETRSNK